MKRGKPPARRTALKRGGYLKRYTRMKPISDKKRAHDRKVNPARRALVASAEKCMKCRKWPPCDPHEIARGSSRTLCLEHPELMLALCQRCHTIVHESNTDLWPLARQVACRLEWELDRMVETLNEIRGRAQTAVTAAEVKAYLKGQRRGR